MDDYQPRNATRPLLTSLSDSPVVLLHGPRQCGKSTLVKHVAQDGHPSRYLTLDDAAVLSAVSNDPAGFLAGLDGPIAIDEVQRAPALFVAIKAAVDRDRQPGRYLLTGSANVLLVPRLAESLAGRMEILTLWPFSQGELAHRREVFLEAVFAKKLPDLIATDLPPAQLYTMLLAGGYPPVLQRSTLERRHAWFGSYITTILERDVRDLANVEALRSLPRLLALIAARSASLLNFAELSRSAAIPQSTLKRYFTLFEATFLARLVPAWSANAGQRLVKSPKVFLVDTGLAGYLLGLDDDRLAADSTLRGAMVETFVAAELAKQVSWSGREIRLYHFRQTTGAEVDFVLEGAAGEIVGIEVKSSYAVAGADFKGLRALAEAAGKKFRRGIVLYTGPESIPFGTNLHALPLTSLWGALRGRN
jgi:uncharacterized protein